MVLTLPPSQMHHSNKDRPMTKIISLQTTVQNPHPDRRSKDWNKLPQIEAGARFIFTDGGALRQSGERWGWCYDNEPLAKLILANSIDVEPESVRELCAVHDCDWGEESILRILLKLGRINADDFVAVANVPDDF
jgi:hypothetical protein